ncbi:hypothetical protein G9A89_000400 [Geosiphon pyriformis]|nr:hypothetical protein G9A89_000400 [Geosiphon pyriformis]
MDTPKKIIIAVLAKFGKIKSIKIQLIGMWQKAVVKFAESDQANLLVSKWSFLIGKNSVCVAKAVQDYLVADFSSSSFKVLTTKISELESKMVALEASINSVLGKLDHLCSDFVWKIAMCNAQGINNPAKQKDIVRWHKDIGNLISIITETKLKDRICLWITDKFDGVHVFTSSLDSEYLGSGVAIIMNFSLAKHVCKVSEVPRLYTGASSGVRFLQTSKINSLIVKTVNKSSFIILGGNFNENGSQKCASFKKYISLELVNSLMGSLSVGCSTWSNPRGAKKTIDYILVSSNLVSVVVSHDVMNIGDYFNTDYHAVSVLVGLGGLLDTKLNSFHKQMNKDH